MKSGDLQRLPTGTPSSLALMSGRVPFEQSERGKGGAGSQPSGRPSVNGAGIAALWVLGNDGAVRI